MKKKKDLDNLRDCVREAFEKGSQRGYEFQKMRFAIITELKGLGYTSSEIKDKLLEWNQRCEKVLPCNEQKRQLLDYVSWTDKHDCKIGCKGLEDFCIGQDKCSFNKKRTHSNRKAVEILPFDLSEVGRFLEIRYKADGYVMELILKALRRHQIEKATGETIFVGVRTIASLIRDTQGHNVDLMTIHRRIQDLVSEGIIEIVVKGKRGTFGMQPANGYRFLRWSSLILNLGHPQEERIQPKIT